MLRPSPNHGTQRLHNDDDDDDNRWKRVLHVGIFGRERRVEINDGTG